LKNDGEDGIIARERRAAWGKEEALDSGKHAKETARSTKAVAGREKKEKKETFPERKKTKAERRGKLNR